MIRPQVAKFYGTGWAYTNDTLFAGQAENFIVYEYGTDGTQDQGLVDALAV